MHKKYEPPLKQQKLVRYEIEPKIKVVSFSINVPVVRVADRLVEVDKSVLSPLLNFINKFQKLNLAGWRIHQMENIVHINYYENSNLHAIASISLLVIEKDYKLEYNVAVHGNYSSDISSYLNNENMDLVTMLLYLMKFKKCVGYKSVQDEAYWSRTTIMDSSFNQASRWVAILC